MNRPLEPESPPEPPMRLPFRLSDFLGGIYSTVSIAVVLIGLVVWTVRQEARINELEHLVKQQNLRMDEFDARGTRAMSERNLVIMEQMKATAQRELEVDERVARTLTIMIDRLGNLENRLSVVTTRQEEAMRDGARRVDKIEQTLERLSPR